MDGLKGYRVNACGVPYLISGRPNLERESRPIRIERFAQIRLKLIPFLFEKLVNSIGHNFRAPVLQVSGNLCIAGLQPLNNCIAEIYQYALRGATKHNGGCLR